MKKLSIYSNKLPVVFVVTIFAMIIYTSSANAGDYTMQTNLNDLAELMSKWSMELSSGKMDQKAQEKLSELLSLTSQVLQDMSAKSGGDMNMEHHKKVEQMKKEWDPFDTSGKM